MVQRCCVPLCTSKAGDLDVYGIKVRFHRMPQSPDRFMRWCIQITDNQKYKPVLTNCSRVCSRHFRKEDYLLKKPFGNNPLKISAEPCIFKWNSACFESNTDTLDDPEDQEDDKEFGTTLVYDLQLRIHREIQCCLLDKRHVEEEVGRKNNVIEQLLGNISILEKEQTSMQEKISELRAANAYYERQIRELQVQNAALEQKIRGKTRQSTPEKISTSEIQEEDELSQPQHKRRRSSLGIPH